jgi:hypothetical protein
LERQRRSGVEHFKDRGDHLDLTGRQVGVGVALRSGAHVTGDPHAVFVAQVVSAALLKHLVARDDLDDPRGIPQVQERHPAVIAPLGHPTREGDGLAGVGGTQGASLVGAKHGRCPSRVARSLLGVPPGQPRTTVGTGWRRPGRF